MSLISIAVLWVISLLIGLIGNTNLRKYSILALSILALFALQPNLPIRYLGFWLPSGTLLITGLSWVITSSKDYRTEGNSWLAIIFIVGGILLVGISRYLGKFAAFIPSQPPQLTQIIFSIILALFAITILSRIPRSINLFWMILIMIIFIIIKSPFLSNLMSVNLRILNNQSPQLATPLDIRWLGFSYIAFRIIHTIRDRQTGKLPDIGLVDYINYVIFFPTLTAGPIDRVENFSKKLNSPITDRRGMFGEGSRRIVTGLFKKFIIADSLSIMALNTTNALQIQSAGWMWICLYAYALQIFFDFSGYTDIAIGLGRFMGIQLPENFSSPYLKANITQFWNNWHMTLTQWFRTYVFNPLTRRLRSEGKKLPAPFVILITQLCMMLMIGIWHGVTINFVLWGLWHGLGLFAHNRWRNYTNLRIQNWASSVIRTNMVKGLGILITFNFVALGWVFFVLPSPGIAWHVIKILFGVV